MIKAEAYADEEPARRNLRLECNYLKAYLLRRYNFATTGRPWVADQNAAIVPTATASTASRPTVVMPRREPPPFWVISCFVGRGLPYDYSKAIVNKIIPYVVLLYHSRTRAVAEFPVLVNAAVDGSIYTRQKLIPNGH